MPKNEKPLTPYKQAQLEAERKEFHCGMMHDTIEDAIVHAEKNLGAFRKPMEPFWGQTRFNAETVVGWKINDQKRYRLDYAPEYLKENAAAAARGSDVNKGTRGVHLNEENFLDPSSATTIKRCHPTHASLQWAETYWRKWTKRYR